MIIETLRSAAESVVAHGLRSTLTTLGISIGVASVIAVVALVQGMQASIMVEFEGLGGNGLSITSFTDVDAAMQGGSARLTPDDLERVARRVEGIESITPLLKAAGSGFLQVRHGDRNTLAQVQGSTHSYQDVYRAYPAQGRFLSIADDRRRRRVCVLGSGMLDKLGLPDDPVGEYIELAGEWLKVVGVMEREGELFGIPRDDYVLIPYGTMQSLNGPDADNDIAIRLTVADGVDRDAIEHLIARVLRQAHRLKPGEPDDFRIEAPDRIADAFDAIGTTITAVIGGVVSISLLVGGVGIMNIMLVSVTERTREIGLLKALGATRRNILLQFLLEALTLSLIGGVLGLAAGYALGAGIAFLIPGLDGIVVPAWAIMTALGFSVIVGIAFGLLPAAKAADLDPVDALRYE